MKWKKDEAKQRPRPLSTNDNDTSVGKQLLYSGDIYEKADDDYKRSHKKQAINDETYSDGENTNQDVLK